jgi:hypothetical protein
MYFIVSNAIFTYAKDLYWLFTVISSALRTVLDRYSTICGINDKIKFEVLIPQSLRNSEESTHLGGIY